MVLALLALLIYGNVEVVTHLSELVAREHFMDNVGLGLFSGYVQLRNGHAYSFLHLYDEVLLNIFDNILIGREGEGLVQMCWLGFRRLFSPLRSLLLGPLGVLVLAYAVLRQTLVHPIALGLSSGGLA